MKDQQGCRVPFGGEDYLMSCVTDRPLDSAIINQTVVQSPVAVNIPGNSTISWLEPIGVTLTPGKPTRECKAATLKPKTPEDVRSYSKAGPRKGNRFGRTKDALES